jgi:hypothetical protein
MRNKPKTPMPQTGRTKGVDKMPNKANLPLLATSPASLGQNPGPGARDTRYDSRDTRPPCGRRAKQSQFRGFWAEKRGRQKKQSQFDLRAEHAESYN